jgi:hypothetical protein
VEPGRVAVIEPDVSVGGAAQRGTAEEVEVLALRQAAAPLDDQEGVGRRAVAVADVVVAGLIAGRGGAPKIAEGHPGDPEQEEVEHGEETELERYR